MTRRQSRPTRRSREEHSAGDKHDRWLISYADLVTLLFALFVVLYAAADHNRARAVAQAIAGQFGDVRVLGPNAKSGAGVLPAENELVKTRELLERQFKNNPRLNSRAHITNTERGIVVSLAEAGFFPPADAEMREDAIGLVDSLAETLKGSSALLRIEGHTDSLPISTQRFPSNWTLSAARASTVLGRLVQQGIPSSRVSIAGFAGERPVADNSTPEGRAANRRVDIVILNSRE